MRMTDLILKKRGGEVLSEKEIDFIVNGFVSGEIKDYQMSAFMMAVCFRGMTGEETAELTRAMTYSGDTIDLSDLPGIKVDKHSTGGVGDTTTLVIAPLVAACGGMVAKLSGRGLGHTGGTLDKLEAVPGVSIEQPISEFKRISRRIGVCVAGQTGDLVPADKLMYALRDVTGTVNSIPLIASSIMSKKIAAGADALVLDVKVGSGAFMKTVDEARELARTMVSIGKSVGRNTVAIITDMDQPLGLCVGNGLEVKEAIDLLSGGIKKTDPLYEVCMILASDMLMLSKLAKDEAEARAKIENAIQSGAGLMKLKALLSALGGDVACIDDPEILCRVKRKIPVVSETAGFVSHMDAVGIGNAAQMLGAGRATKSDVIDPAVGLIMHKRLGDRVEKGEAFATLYVNDEKRIEEAKNALTSAVLIGDERPEHAPMVHDIIR